MKKRLLLRILAGMSVVLAIAVVVVWCLSYTHPLHWQDFWFDHHADIHPPKATPAYGDEVVLTGDPAEVPRYWHKWSVRSWEGHVTIARQYVEASANGYVTGGPPTFVLVPHRTETGRRDGPSVNDPSWEPKNLINRFGFGYEHDAWSTPASADPAMGTIHLWLVPYWFLALMCLPVPLLWLRANRRSVRWAREGRCARCGYDLRASSERCPECGNAVQV